MPPIVICESREFAFTREDIMNHYNTVSAYDAHNAGLLAAIRSRNTDLDPPRDLWTEEELMAWQDGVAEGCVIRSYFDTADRLPRPAR
jgi:hypothetical protein